MHGLDSNLPVLRRWAALSEQPLPTDWRGFCDNNATESLKIRIADPELVSLLDGTAPASLRADAIDGTWGERPSAEEVAEQARKDAVAEIKEAGNPFAAETQNITNQMRLRQLDPMLAASLQKAAEPAADQWSEANIRAAEARNKKAISDSHQFGQSLAAAQYRGRRR